MTRDLEEKNKKLNFSLIISYLNTIFPNFGTGKIEYYKSLNMY